MAEIGKKPQPVQTLDKRMESATRDFFFGATDSKEGEEIEVVKGMVEQQKELTPEEQADPELIQTLKSEDRLEQEKRANEAFFAGARPTTPDEDSELLNKNQTLIDQLLVKGTKRFFAEDIQDPFLIPRSLAIATGAIGASVLTNELLPPTTPPPVRGALTFGAGFLGTFFATISPEFALEVGESLSLITPGTRKQLGLNMMDLQTVLEGEALLDAAFGTGFVALRQMAKMTGKFFTTGGKLTKQGREALGVAETGEKFGIHLLPVQIRGRTIAQGFVSLFGHFPFTTGKLKRRAIEVEKQAKAAIQGLGSRIAPLATFSELSREMFTQANRYFGAVGRKFNIEYTRLYDRAEAAGIKTIPTFTTQKARQLLQTMESARAVFAKGAEKTKGGLGAITGKFAKFLREEFIPLETQILTKGAEKVSPLVDEFGKPIITKLPDAPANIARQDMKQMDGLIDQIDEFMSTLDKANSQDSFVIKMATQLRQAVKADLLKNTVGKNKGEAQDIINAFKNLDEEYSLTMSQIFETATANKMKSVTVGGVRGIKELKPATRQPVDMLAKSIVQLDSPQAMLELRKLVGDKTFNRVAAQVINDAVEKSMKTVEGAEGAIKQFNLDSFIKNLGIQKGFGNRRAAISTMLETSGSPFRMEDLDGLVRVLGKIETLRIPNVATFVARRAILGGWRSALGAFIPGITAMSAGTGTALAGGGALMTMFVAGIFFIGGSQAFSRIISNPETAKNFLKVLDTTASDVVRRTAYIRMMRTWINRNRADDPDNVDPKKMEHFREMMEEFDDILEIGRAHV